MLIVCVAASDFRLIPYQAEADNPAPTPTYMTNPFTAHGLTWGVHADIENVFGSTTRKLRYKLVLQTKPRVPILLSYVILKGPYASITLSPDMHEFQFMENAVETPYRDVPCCDQLEGNAFVASRSIKLRLALIQVKK